VEKRNSIQKDVESVVPWDFFPSYRCNKRIFAGRWTGRHMEKCIGAFLCGVQKPSPVQYLHDLFEKYPKPPLCSHSPLWSIRTVLFKMHCAFDLPVRLGLFQLTS